MRLRLWNSLPIHVRGLHSSLDTFYWKLKTYLIVLGTATLSDCCLCINVLIVKSTVYSSSASIIDRQRVSHSQFSDVRQTLERRVASDTLQLIVHQLSIARTHRHTT